MKHLVTEDEIAFRHPSGGIILKDGTYLMAVKYMTLEEAKELYGKKESENKVYMICPS